MDFELKNTLWGKTLCGEKEWPSVSSVGVIFIYLITKAWITLHFALLKWKTDRDSSGKLIKRLIFSNDYSRGRLILGFKVWKFNNNT